MKLIHCADIHLGSKIEAKLPRGKAEIRRSEVRRAVSRMIDFAKANDICHILLAGDIFDSDRPFKKDKSFFYDVIRANPAISFYYLRGNHDTEESYTEGLDNLFTFDNDGKWLSYEIDDREHVTITGIELSEENRKSAPSTLSLDPSRIHVVMLHGEVIEGERKDKINLAKYRSCHIDYLALGHIHTYASDRLDDRGCYAYPGCLEGRGYDEMGPKGFIVLDITDGVVTHTFHENSIRTIREYDVDITGATDAYSAAARVREQVAAPQSDLVRVNLVGEVTFDNTDLADDLTEQLEGTYFHLSIKNRTLHPLDLSCDEGDISLRAEFIRTVMANDDYKEDEKRAIITLGLRALAGREV